MRFLKRPEIKILPRASDAGRQNESVSKVFADTWHVCTAANDKNLLDFFILRNTFAVVTDDLFGFSDDTTEAWFEGGLNFVMIIALSEAVKDFILVSFF